MENKLNARRRCDDCGIRTEIKSDKADECILECSQCGKEYHFFKSSQEERLMRKMKEHASTYDIIIVGGGPGGLSAGIYAKRAAMSTVLIEKGNAGGQMAVSRGIENYPGFIDINGNDLSNKFLQHAKWYGLEILGEEVIAIEPGAGFHTVRLANERTLNAYAVILAAGGISRTLRVPGEIENLGRGVSYCALCDGFFFEGRAVAVTGDGDNALEEALYLAMIAPRVHLIHSRNTFRASGILQERIRMEPKIQVISETTVTKIISDGDGVSAIVVKNGDGIEKEIDVQGIFISAGFTVNNKLVPAGVKMSEKGHVFTDEKCETSIPGLFVIGDLREKYAHQIVAAASDGCVSALAAVRCVGMKKAGFTDCKLTA